MRESIKHFAKIVSETFPIEEPIFEFGSLQVPGQEGFADLRPMFPNKEYIGCDLRNGPGVDRIIDLTSIPMPVESIGTILILDTLEHVEYPRKAVGEVHRTLKKDGIAVLTSVMNFPIHSCPYDYWRFTPEGFKTLLKSFAFQFVVFAGDDMFPHTVVGVAAKHSVSEESFAEFRHKCGRRKKQWTGPRDAFKNYRRLFISKRKQSF